MFVKRWWPTILAFLAVILSILVLVAACTPNRQGDVYFYSQWDGYNIQAGKNSGAFYQELSQLVINKTVQVVSGKGTAEAIFDRINVIFTNAPQPLMPILYPDDLDKKIISFNVVPDDKILEIYIYVNPEIIEDNNNESNSYRASWALIAFSQLLKNDIDAGKALGFGDQDVLSSIDIVSIQSALQKDFSEKGVVVELPLMIRKTR